MLSTSRKASIVAAPEQQIRLSAQQRHSRAIAALKPHDCDKLQYLDLDLRFSPIRLNNVYVHSPEDITPFAHSLFPLSLHDPALAF
jgi:hypothetical protein